MSFRDGLFEALSLPTQADFCARIDIPSLMTNDLLNFTVASAG